MNEYSFSELPSTVNLRGDFDETCILTLPQTTANQLELGQIRLTIINMGSGTNISGLRVFVGSTVGKITLRIGDNNANIYLAEGTSGAYDLRLWSNSLIRIGKNTTSNGVTVVCYNSEFLCGEDCMFSSDILIQTSDQHGIINTKTGQIVNGGFKSVALGDHVWLGRNCTLTSSAKIGKGSIIGTGAIVTGNIPEKVIAAGIPARVIKHSSTWSRYPNALDNFSKRYVEEDR